MPKIYYLFALFLVIASCKDDKVLLEDNPDTDWDIVASKLPGKIALNSKSEAVVKDWVAYKTFDANFDRIYKATYREDLVLIIDDLVENQKVLEASTYPTEFDIPQVKGRQKIVKTFILKTKGDLEYRQHPKIAIEEMIAAYNGFRNQFNVVVNNTLPKDLISNSNDAN